MSVGQPTPAPDVLAHVIETRLRLRSMVTRATLELWNFTDQMHRKYGGPVGCYMVDETWLAMAAEEVARYRELERATPGRWRRRQ